MKEKIMLEFEELQKSVLKRNIEKHYQNLFAVIDHSKIKIENEIKTGIIKFEIVSGEVTMNNKETYKIVAYDLCEKFLIEADNFIFSFFDKFENVLKFPNEDLDREKIFKALSLLGADLMKEKVYLSVTPEVKQDLIRQMFTSKLSIDAPVCQEIYERGNLTRFFKDNLFIISLYNAKEDILFSRDCTCGLFTKDFLQLEETSRDLEWNFLKQKYILHISYKYVFNPKGIGILVDNFNL